MTELEQQLKRELNDSQYNAATHMAGPAVIRAGAGSGKTHTLTSRIMHLVDSGADPKKIVMLTFTNAAANEMKARAMRLAVMNAIGTPLNGFGISVSASFSRIQDIRTIARRNPRPAAIPATKLSIAL